MLVLGDGFDHYPTSMILQKWDDKPGTPTIDAAYGRLGSLGCRIVGNILGGLVKNLPAANSSFGFFGAAVYVPAYGSLRRQIFAVSDATQLFGANVTATSICLEVDGSFTVRNQDSGLGWGTVRATSAPGRVAAGTWNYIEVKIKGHATTGSVEIRVNEVVVLTATNINTQNQCASAAFTRAWLGGSDGNSPTWETTYFDDWYYCDDTGSQNNTYLGDVQLQAIYPAGAGSSTQWAIDGTSPAATNWQSVNEHSPDDDVTYVKDATVGHLDMYTMDSTSATAAGIKGLLINARVKKDDATARTYSTMVKDVSGSGTTTAVATRTTPFGGYTNQQDVSELTPAGATWTKTKVDAIECGIKVIS